MKITNETFYAHDRDYQPTHSGFFRDVVCGKGGRTLAFRVKEDTDNILFAVGYAQCSPKDNFCKRIGRAIAEGRLEKAPVLVEMSKEYVENNSVHDVVEHLFETFFYVGDEH